MLNSAANLNVVLFFALGSGIFALLGFKFWMIKVNPFKNFGIGLAMIGLAFLGWGAIVAMRPEDLANMMALAILPFVLGFIFLVRAATFNWKKSNQMLILIIALVFLAVLFALRTWVYPSEPGFSENGLLYFHANNLVLLMYVLAFAGAFMPALHVVTTRIKIWRQAALGRIFFNLIVLGGVILMVSMDDEMQTLNSLILGAGFIGLLANFGFGKIEVESE